jgi:hypothetical protein
VADQGLGDLVHRRGVPHQIPPAGGQGGPPAVLSAGQVRQRDVHVRVRIPDRPAGDRPRRPVCHRPAEEPRPADHRGVSSFTERSGRAPRIWASVTAQHAHPVDTKRPARRWRPDRCSRGCRTSHSPSAATRRGAVAGQVDGRGAVSSGGWTLSVRSPRAHRRPRTRRTPRFCRPTSSAARVGGRPGTYQPDAEPARYGDQRHVHEQVRPADPKFPG